MNLSHIHNMGAFCRPQEFDSQYVSHNQLTIFVLLEYYIMKYPLECAPAVTTIKVCQMLSWWTKNSLYAPNI